MRDPRQVILVLDGERSASDEVQSLLQREGHPVERTASPVELLRRCADPDVSAVLLALQPSGTDRLEALRLVRAAQTRRYVPILVSTAEHDREGRLAALRAGADDVISGPLDPEELLARVDRLLQLHGRFAALVRETEHLHTLSITDGLTRIHNHRFFQERLKEEFRRAQRYDDPLALLLLDVDHFKEVNDRYGHVAGDQVLREVADSLRESVRDTDLLARYGGEEFAVLLPRSHLAGALTVAERVWRGIAGLASSVDRDLRVTCSVGLSGFPGRSILSAEQLLQSADEALYRAKREGRNRICLPRQMTPGDDSPARAG